MNEVMLRERIEGWHELKTHVADSISSPITWMSIIWRWPNSWTGFGSLAASRRHRCDDYPFLLSSLGGHVDSRNREPAAREKVE